MRKSGCVYFPPSARDSGIGMKNLGDRLAVWGWYDGNFAIQDSEPMEWSELFQKLGVTPQFLRATASKMEEQQ